MSGQSSHTSIRRRVAAAPRSLLVPTAVLIAVAVLLLVGLLGRFGDGSPGTASPPSAAEESQPDLARRTVGDPRALGEVDAPVVMVMWSDFQCPFCGRFARETQPRLVERYVDTGVLRIEWRDFPYIGPESLPAAVAGRAAAAQGRFWEFGEVVYGQERRPRSDDFDAARLRAYADQAGLDLAAYDAAVAGQAGSDEVRAELAEASRLGVTGTPAFLINGEPVIGAQPLESFVAVIEQAAAAAGRPVS